MDVSWERIRKQSSTNYGKAVQYIESLIELKYDLEERGISGFDSFLESEEFSFAKIAARLVQEGYSPELSEKVLSNVLNAEEFDDEEYLQNVLFSEFVLAIQSKSIGIQELRIRLFSYLGARGVKKMLTGF